MTEDALQVFRERIDRGTWHVLNAVPPMPLHEAEFREAADSLARILADPETVENKQLRDAVEFAIYRHADCGAHEAERAAPKAIEAVLVFLAQAAIKGERG